MDGGNVLGVDFGTSNTAAALRTPDGQVRPLLFDGVPQLPSAVFVTGTTRLAGRDALHHGLAQPAGRAGLRPGCRHLRRHRRAAHPRGRRRGREPGLDGVGGLDVDAAVVASLAATVRPGDPAWERLLRPVTADVEVPIGREQFDALAGPVLAPTVDLARAVVADAGLTPADLAAVLLVGGSSRLPLVASLVHRALGLAPALVDQPELAVALGSVTDAARQAPVPTRPATWPSRRARASAVWARTAPVRTSSTCSSRCGGPRPTPGPGVEFTCTGV